MTTAYSDVYDLFLVQIKDWKIDALYAASVPNFSTYLKGFLVLTVPKFTVFCDQSLARDDSGATFDEDLTDKNKQMLARLMIQEWLKKEVQDIRQMNLHFNGREYKTYSEAKNLDSKQDYLIFVTEQNEQAISDYAWNAQDFTDWNAYTWPTGA